MLLNVFCSPGRNVCGAPRSRQKPPAQTPPPQDAINIERILWPALPSYNNSVRTKVNALNLISVLVIFDGVAMRAKGCRDAERGRSLERDR